MSTPMPTLTPGSNGYLAVPAPTDYGANPWASAPGETAQIQTQVDQGTQNVQDMGSAMQTYATQSAAYPSFPNSAGVGSQSAFGAAPAQAPALQANPQNAWGAMQDPVNSNSQGFSPYSLRGEAMSR